MFAYVIAAMLLMQSQTPIEAPVQPRTEQFGAWSVRLRVDPMTDNVSIGGYLGTSADNIAIACAKDFPDSTLVIWRSRTRFRETGFIPRAPGEFIAAGMPVGSTAYRFDQDEPVTTASTVREGYTAEVGSPAVVVAMMARIATASRFVLMDRVNEPHVAVFNLVPADTVRMLRRLDEVCGTTYSSASPS